jgi:hypothetical protein
MILQVFFHQLRVVFSFTPAFKTPAPTIEDVVAYIEN